MLFCLVLGILLYFCCVVVAFAALADVPSGCAAPPHGRVRFIVSERGRKKENRCLLRAALVIHVLGLLLLVVAMVLLAMKTHRVMSLTPDPQRASPGRSCQEGGYQRSVFRRAHRVLRLLRRGLVRGRVRGRALVVREGAEAPVLPGIGKIWQILGLGKDKTPERVRDPTKTLRGNRRLVRCERRYFW